jgi:cell division protein FtsB
MIVLIKSEKKIKTIRIIEGMAKRGILTIFLIFWFPFSGIGMKISLASVVL